MSKKLLYVLLAVLISSSSYAVGEYHRIGPKVFSRRWHDFNNCQIPMTNYGEFGYMYGIWPTGSGEIYIFGAGIWIGAMKNGDVMVSCGYNTVGAGNDWMPGPPEHNYDHSVDRFSHPEDRIYLSTDFTDREEWPLRDSLGFRIILSGQDAWSEYNDLWEPSHASWEPGTYPLGLTVRQHSFCWRVPSLLENMFFILYQMENLSGDTIEEMYVGIGADTDVGWGIEGELVGCDMELGIGYTYYVHDDWWFRRYKYVGVAVLQGPRASDTVYIADGPSNPDYPYAYRDTVYPGEHLPLTALTECTRGYDTSCDLERYLALKGYDFESHTWDPWRWTDIPDDKRMVLGCGPFELEPGEVDTFMIAVMFSNDSTGGLPYLLSEAAIAKSVASAVTNRPSVSVVSPNGGEEVAGTVPINWETLGEEIDRIDLYLSSDSGGTWSDLAMGLRNTGSHLWNSRIAADGSYLLKICGRDSLLYTWDLSDGEFKVNNLHLESLPLHSFPNPLSSSTTIRFYVPQQGEVSLTIYDAAGRGIKQPVCGVRTCGMDAVVWDATDNSGRKVPSGSYFLRLEAGEYSATRKLCVVR